MQTTKDKFERTLRTMLQEEVNNLMESMANGHLESHSDYKFLAGRIHGLRAALDAMIDADREVERG